jgi:hypothetical protein
MRRVIDEYVQEEGMPKEDSEKLNGVLLMAEKKWRSRLLNFECVRNK